MRLKLTFFLLSLNVLLFSLLIYLDHKQDSEKAYEANSALVLPMGIVDQSVELSIEGKSLPTAWDLTRDESDNWRIVQPISWPANTYAVSRILDQLKYLEWETSFSISDLEKAGQTLADYGLANPQATLSIRTPEQTVRIRLGQSTKIGNRIYILSPEGDHVHVVNKDLFDAIALNLENLRNPAIFDIPLYEAKAISIQAGDTNTIRVLLARRGRDWVFEAPIRTDADPLRMETYLNALLNGEAVSFVSTDLGRQRLDTPTARIAIEGNNRRQILILGESFNSESGEKLTYARRNDSDSVFTIPSRILEPLLNAQETLRERKFNYFDLASVNALEISVSDKATGLQKLETGKWQIRTGSNALASWDVDPKVIENLLNRLCYMEAERFVTDAPAEADLEAYGFNDPLRVVKLAVKGQKNRTIYFGGYNKENDTVYTKLQAEPYIYEVPMSIVRLLNINPLDYRERILEDLPSSARITQLSISDNKSEEPLLQLALPEINADWGSVLAGLPEEKQQAVIGLLQDIRQFKVLSYISDTFTYPMAAENPEDPALWDFCLHAEIHLPGANEKSSRSITYYFTKRMGGGTQFGGSKEKSVVFKLAQPMIDHLFLLLENEKPEIPEIADPQPIEAN